MRGHSFIGATLCTISLCILAAACGARAVPPSGDGALSTRQYVVKHRAQLEAEIAIGSGSGLRDLARVADCRDIPELGRTLHRRRAQIFPVPPPSDAAVADQVLTILMDETELVCRDLELGPNRPFNAGRRHVVSSNER
jgi:hypothetical protein